MRKLVYALALLPSIALADTRTDVKHLNAPGAPIRVNSQITACFTPRHDCTSLIVHEIEAAKSRLLVQAYYFTSPQIIQSIVNAKIRGVEVKVILDKVNCQQRYTGINDLMQHGIIPLIDYRPPIAHSKIIVIDGGTVITGSFNLTKKARWNTENVLLISDNAALASTFAENWRGRAAVSRPYSLH